MVRFVAEERGKAGGAYKQRKRGALEAICKCFEKIVHGFMK